MPLPPIDQSPVSGYDGIVIGRPSAYTPEIAAEICDRIANGSNVVEVCEAMDLEPRTVFRWAETHEDFRQAYARARISLADVLSAQVVTLADRPREGRRIEVKTEGEAEVAQALRADQVGQEIRVKTESGPLAMTVTEDMVGQQVTMLMGVPQITTKVLTADMVDRAKLQVDARKWYAARMAPHVYGDRLAHQMLDENGQPAKLEITVTRVARKREESGS